MQSSQYKQTKLFVLTALFIALIFIVTAYILHIPTTNGYIHLGDAFLYIAASILPTPFAVAAGGIGEALSDVLTGYAVYAPATLIIKSAMALCFTAAGKSIINKRNIAASVIAGVICIGGYYLAEVIIYHSFASPLVNIPSNLVQAGASAAIYLVAGKAFDGLKVSKRLGSFIG